MSFLVYAYAKQALNEILDLLLKKCQEREKILLLFKQRLWEGDIDGIEKMIQINFIGSSRKKALNKWGNYFQKSKERMQITRQRVRPEMNIETSEKCPTCKGSGKITPTVLVIDELENNINYYTHNGNYSKMILRVHPFIASYLTKGFINSLRRQWARKYHCRIRVIADPSYQLLEYHFLNKEEEEILE